MLLMGKGGAKIKSVQTGTTNFGNNDRNVTATIDAVDLTKTFVIADYRGGGENLSSLMCTAALTSPTTLSFQRETADGNCTIYWQVIELEGNASVQSFATTFTATSTNVTISKVDPARAFVVTTCRTKSNATGFSAEAGHRVRSVIQSNGTTVALSRLASSVETTVVGFVVEVK